MATKRPKEEKEEFKDEGIFAPPSASWIGKKKREEKRREVELTEELADLPLEELIALKDELGSKLFHKAAFKGDEDATTSHGRKDFKRDNRRRPQEISAKKRVSKYREVVHVGRTEKWDPRFDDRSEFDETVFKRDYGFLGEIRKGEISQLRQKIKMTTDPDRKAHLKEKLLRQKNKEVTEAAKEAKKARLRTLRKSNEARLAEGKAPVFKRRAELREAETDEKFEALRKSGKLDKYLKRKAKKVARKSTAHPDQYESDGD